MKTVAIFSGGVDSTTLLYHLRGLEGELVCLSVDYGQKHRCELKAARKIAQTLRLHHEVVDISGLKPLFSNSALTSDSLSVPHGHYTAEGMKTTVVPNRNMIFLSLATAWAVNCGAGVVAYAAHAGDHTIYPDCRPEFVAKMAEAISLCDWSPVSLEAPFLKKSKAEIVSLGASLGVCFESTWSCYEGGEVHCGKCGTCVERREAFKLAEVKDPTVYSSYQFT